ncbi:hypothetical protein A4X13_0g8499, partial [Tilletia indica]
REKDDAVKYAHVQEVEHQRVLTLRDKTLEELEAQLQSEKRGREDALERQKQLVQEKVNAVERAQAREAEH